MSLGGVFSVLPGKVKPVSKARELIPKRPAAESLGEKKGNRLRGHSRVEGEVKSFEEGGRDTGFDCARRDQPVRVRKGGGSSSRYRVETLLHQPAPVPEKKGGISVFMGLGQAWRSFLSPP